MLLITVVRGAYGYFFIQESDDSEEIKVDTAQIGWDFLSPHSK